MSDTVTRSARMAADRARGLAGVFQGFRDFISRGNAVELAVGVVIGAAFTTVIGAIQDGLISPLIGMLFGKPEISWMVGPINGSTIDFGLIVNAFIQFLLTAAAIYFVIVLPLNKLAERRKRGLEQEPARPSEDILLLQQIRDLLAAGVPARSGGPGVSRSGDFDPSGGHGRHGVPGDPTGHPPIA